MALTKPGADLDLCQEIAATTVVEGVNDSLAADYAAAIHLQLALTDETAHAGTIVTTQVNSSDAGTNTDWVDYDEFTALAGTANQQVLNGGGEGIGDTVIEVADTTGYVTDGAWLFLEDTTTFVDSEWVQQKSHIGNTSITIIDGLARAKDNADSFSNVAQTRFIRLPFATRQVRIIYNNAGNCTIAVRSRIVEVTAVS